MAVSGNIDLWADRFPQDQIRRIVQLVLDSWCTFEVPADHREVPITQKLCVHLRNRRDRSIHFFRVEFETWELDNEGETIGRIDLRFSQGVDERVYFSLECKRLRVCYGGRLRRFSNEYVTQGMFRYFTGQYARALDRGGMLAYVMDGNVLAAIGDVKTSIERNRDGLHMTPDSTLRPSSLSEGQARESLHQYGPYGQFIIYHIFVPSS